MGDIPRILLVASAAGMFYWSVSSVGDPGRTILSNQPSHGGQGNQRGKLGFER